MISTTRGMSWVISAFPSGIMLVPAIVVYLNLRKQLCEATGIVPLDAWMLTKPGPFLGVE